MTLLGFRLALGADGLLAEFFREVQSANCDIAERAQRLLAVRL